MNKNTLLLIGLALIGIGAYGVYGPVPNPVPKGWWVGLAGVVLAIWSRL